MTCLRLIRQRIFVTPIAIPWRNFCTQLQIFFYRGESERACYDTPLIRRFCSAAFPVRNGRRYFIYEKSRVLSFSHTILSPIPDFHVYLFDIVLPVQFQSINKVLVPIFFSRNFRTDPHECTVSLGWNKMETCKRFNVSFFRNIVYLS